MTLLELLIVVAILAVLATVAIQSTTDIGNQARYDATLKSLSAFRSALLGPSGQTAPDGSPMATGFIADMGRVPRSSTLTHPSYGDVPDLTEVYSETIPSGLKAYALHTAVLGNVSLTSIGSVTDTVNMYDLAVRVPAGWRGPYLRKASGDATLVDGWHKALVSRVDLGSSPSALNTWPTMLLAFRTNSASEVFGLPEDANYTAVTDVGREVVGIFSASGFEGAPTSTDAYAGRFYSTVQTNEYRVPIVVSVTISSTLQAEQGTTSYLLICLYGPNPDVTSDAKPVRVWVQQIPFDSGTALNLAATFDSQNAPTVGTRVIRAVLKGSSTTTKGRVVYVPIQQGYQSVNVPFP